MTPPCKSPGISAVACATPLLSLALSSCFSMQSDVLKDHSAGAPLVEFKAGNGHYFPLFLTRFFRSAQKYSRQFPNLASASSEVRLIEVQPLTQMSTRQNEANLSWSADGAYLGYEIVANGLRRIMLKDLVGDYARELQVAPRSKETFLDGMVIRSAQSYNAGLRWSRDSTRFAFMSNGGVGEYNIYVGAIGAAEKTLASSPSKDGYATWSPVSNELAFVSGRTGSGDIYLVNLEVQDPIRLSHGNEVDIFPEWAPDGLSLVFSSGDALNHDLYIVSRKSLASSWSKPRAFTISDRDDLRPTISPDGRHVAFYSDGGEKDGVRIWNIHVAPLRTETLSPWTEEELERMKVARDVVIDLNTGPAWSPDGRKIFYVKRDPTVHNPIYAYDLYAGRTYIFKTGTAMNRDIVMSKLGVLSFRAQEGVWEKVFVALTNQGLQLQKKASETSKVHYL